MKLEYYRYFLMFLGILFANSVFASSYSKSKADYNIANVSKDAAVQGYQLEHRFTPPKTWSWGRYTDDEGKSIRYGKSEVDNPKAIIVMTVGFADLIEQFFETIRYWNRKGYSVWATEWYGQGDSGRAAVKGHPTMVTARDYKLQAKQLDKFNRQVIRNPYNVKKISITHSMGGAIVAHNLKHYPGGFDAAIFTSPMLKLKIGFLSGNKFLEALGGAVLSAYGWYVNRKFNNGEGNEYSWTSNSVGGGDWKFMSDTKSVLEYMHTHDYARGFTNLLYAQIYPALRMSGPTYTWLHYANKAMSEIGSKGFLETTKELPIMFILEGDSTSSVATADVLKGFCARFPNCNSKVIKGSDHAIIIEKDEYRNLALKYIDEFISKHAN